jgi:hypothetical protein
MSKEARTETDVRGRNFNLRAYLAGGGATVALIAAAVLVFASLGAYVAFEGLPVGNGEDDAAQVAVEQSEPAAQVRSSRASGDTGADARGGGGAASGSSSSSGDTGDRGSAASSSDLTTAPAPASGGDSGSGGSSPAAQPVEPASETNAAGPASNQGTGGPIAQPVTEAETALGDATGLPIDLPDAVTAPLDDTLDGVGNVLDGAGTLGEDLVGGLGGG